MTDGTGPAQTGDSARAPEGADRHLAGASPAPSAADVQALLSRVASLEARVVELERSASLGHRAPAPPPPATYSAYPGAANSAPPPAVAAAPTAPPVRRDPVDWVSRAGIALLVLGCGFLFKYSVDQGWLGPGARVVLGGGLTVALFALGTRYRHRPAFGDVLTGGAVACALLTLFAAHVLYELIPFGPAFVGCALASLLAFILAVRRSREAIAVTALLGAYTTPFVLEAPEPATPFLLAFLVVATVAGGAATTVRPWRALHLLGAFGAFTCVVLVGERAEGVVLPLIYMTVSWAAFAALPLVRAHGPHRDGSAGSIAIVATLACTFLTQVPFDVAAAGQLIVGAMTLTLALLCVWSLRALRGCHSEAAATCAIALCAFASFTMRPLDELPGVLGLAGLALFELTRRTSVRAPMTTWGLVGAGLFTACIASYVLGTSAAEEWTFLGGASTLTAIVTYAAVSVRAPEALRRGLPPLLAQVALFGWTASVLVEPFGPPVVSIAWGVIAVGELAVGMFRRHRPLQQLGLAGVAALMVKLVLLDLANTPAVWRILLFMGFGVVFLGLGYVAARLDDDAT